MGKLPQDLKGQYSAVPWQDIKDFRNLLIHEYFGVDLELVWQVICDELPLLLKTVVEIVKRSQYQQDHMKQQLLLCTI